MRIETKRLLIREAAESDEKEILKLLNDPNYIRMIRDSGVRSESEARNYIINTYIKSYRENGFGLYLIERLEDFKFIGICGFVKRSGLEIPDLGFAVLSEYARMGYTLEASQAVLDYGRSQLNLRKVAAITTEENKGSNKVLAKLGFLFVSKMKVPDNDKDFSYFELTF